MEEKPKAKARAFNISKREASVLFDSGASRSFVSTAFCSTLTKSPERVDDLFEVEVAVGKFVSVSRAIQGCFIELSGYKFLVRLYLMPLGCFDVVLGMDWHESVDSQIIFDQKLVRLRAPDGTPITFFGDWSGATPHIISMLKAEKLIQRGCWACLAYAINVKTEVATIVDVPIVRDYPDVVPDDLSDVPLDREVEFQIDLMPGAKPVALAPYRLAPNKMKELMAQLEDLLDKGFIQPSISPSGAQSWAWMCSYVAGLSHSLRLTTVKAS
ncbi:uncharacterized protein LOC143616367 [Bidens hawaiensis]|uniref:uncharacterized protein LOC143616367 n=1 Tax=Bidens hawaiensis TaxID=980011 RepID=UPI0040490D8D